MFTPAEAGACYTTRSQSKSHMPEKSAAPGARPAVTRLIPGATSPAENQNVPFCPVSPVSPRVQYGAPNGPISSFKFTNFSFPNTFKALNSLIISLHSLFKCCASLIIT